MKHSQELMLKANIIPRLKLAAKDEKGAVRGTGPHKVKILEDKLQKGKDPQTGEVRDITRFIFEEDGVKKQYDVPIKDKAGELHYLIQRLSEVPEGAEITLEYKRKGLKGYIHVTTDSESEIIAEDDAENEEVHLEYPKEDLGDGPTF